MVSCDRVGPRLTNTLCENLLAAAHRKLLPARCCGSRRIQERKYFVAWEQTFSRQRLSILAKAASMPRLEARAILQGGLLPIPAHPGSTVAFCVLLVAMRANEATGPKTTDSCCLAQSPSTPISALAPAWNHPVILLVPCIISIGLADSLGQYIPDVRRYVLPPRPVRGGEESAYVQLGTLGLYARPSNKTRKIFEVLVRRVLAARDAANPSGLGSQCHTFGNMNVSCMATCPVKQLVPRCLWSEEQHWRAF